MKRFICMFNCSANGIVMPEISYHGPGLDNIR